MTGQGRALLVVVAVIGAVGVAAGVAGMGDHVAAAVLIVAGLGWLVVAVLRRERRIRARLADPRTQPAPRPPGGVPRSRVGPGDDAPVSPAPTRRPGDTAGVAPTNPIPAAVDGGSS